MNKAVLFLLALLLLAIPAALSAQDATEPPTNPLSLDAITQAALVGVDGVNIQTAYRIALPRSAGCRHSPRLR